MTEMLNYTPEIIVSPRLIELLAGDQDYMEQIGEEWKNWVAAQPQRTGLLANTADFALHDGEMDLLAQYYLHYLFMGTGIHGPRGVPYGPVSAQALRWQAWPSGEDVVRMWSSGTIWEGALEDARATLENQLRTVIPQEPVRPAKQGFFKSLLGWFKGFGK